MWDQKEYKAGDNPAFFILIIINNKSFNNLWLFYPGYVEPYRANRLEYNCLAVGKSFIIT